MGAHLRAPRLAPLRLGLVPWGVAIAIGLGLATIAAFLLLDPSALLHPPPGTDQYVYAQLGLSAGTVALAFFWEAVFTTLGEEVFFSGLLGGWLMERFGFQLGNLLQAVWSPGQTVGGRRSAG